MIVDELFELLKYVRVLAVQDLCDLVGGVVLDFAMIGLKNERHQQQRLNDLNQLVTTVAAEWEGKRSNDKSKQKHQKKTWRGQKRMNKNE